MTPVSGPLMTPGGAGRGSFTLAETDQGQGLTHLVPS